MLGVVVLGLAIAVDGPSMAAVSAAPQGAVLAADGARPGEVSPRPVAVAPVSGRVVRPFEQPRTRYGPGHRGVDLAVVAGEPVIAAMSGSVRFAGAVAGEVWVTVAHAGGIETTYGGLRPTVAEGDRVALGQRLGVMRSGRETLDWGARIAGDYIDPLGLLAGWRVRLVPVEDR